LGLNSNVAADRRSQIDASEPREAGESRNHGSLLFEEVFTRIGYRYWGLSRERAGRQGTGGGFVPTRCAKTRFEATILLKTQEVDLERTQIRTHFEAVLDLNWLRFEASWGGPNFYTAQYPI
jgi:hypothetical protein